MILGGGVAVCLLLLAQHAVIFVIVQLSCTLISVLTVCKYVAVMCSCVAGCDVSAAAATLRF